MVPSYSLSPLYKPSHFLGSPAKEVRLAPLIEEGKGGPERASDSPEATQLVKGPNQGLSSGVCLRMTVWTRVS